MLRLQLFRLCQGAIGGFEITELHPGDGEVYARDHQSGIEFHRSGESVASLGETGPGQQSPAQIAVDDRLVEAPVDGHLKETLRDVHPALLPFDPT